MKQELILLATKKGFTSKMFSDTEWKHSDREDIRYYLWLRELLAWLGYKPDVKKLEDVLLILLKNS